MDKLATLPFDIQIWRHIIFQLGSLWLDEVNICVGNFSVKRVEEPNPQWLELPMSITNFHGLLDVRAIKLD